MKRLMLAAAVLTAVLIIPVAVAGNGPANKATGDIWFMNTGYPTPVLAHWVFDAHEGTTAKGSVFYEDVYGSYTADVIKMQVLNSHQDATFTAVVTSSTYPYAVVGDTFTWTVHDVDEPGVGSDFFTYLPEGGVPFDLPPITAGNIQVHYCG